MVRSEVEYTQQLCDTCARELAEEFRAWAQGPAGAGFRGAGGAGGPELLDVGEGGWEHIAGQGGGGNGLPSPSGHSVTSGLTSVSRREPAVMGSVASSAATGQTQGSRPAATGGAGLLLPKVHRTPPRPGAVIKARPPIPFSPPRDDGGDPEAAAYYSAQQQLIQKTGSNVQHRPGSIKKNRVPASFGYGGKQ
jgi:hypothetical protein